jgi:hypothetical protein
MLLRGGGGGEFEDRSRRARLGEEVDKALQFSLELFSSRSQVRCESLRSLPVDWIRVFKPTNPVLELYQADRIDHPEEYDGRPVTMVVQPAIIAWGNEDGRDYSAYRVLTKGQVCVEL